MAIDTSMHVLIVDDYKTMLRIIRNLLRQIGIVSVAEAASGAEALSALRGGESGLVISDWTLAPMTGLQLLRAVRADDRLKRLPFIMITADGSAEKVAVATAAGVSGMIVKPFTAGMLSSTIEQALARA
jgi:two-component system chemotaxis response regulator CheY